MHSKTRISYNGGIASKIKEPVLGSASRIGDMYERNKSESPPPNASIDIKATAENNEETLILPQHYIDAFNGGTESF
jgi:hypothetical protein